MQSKSIDDPAMSNAPEFQPYGLPHLTVIFITIGTAVGTCCTGSAHKIAAARTGDRHCVVSGADLELHGLSDFHP